MNNNPLISIVVPAYNVEKYIDRCLWSILSQTYNNLEIIVVNDGSFDNTGKICEGYQKLDDRIVLINQENQGLSCARNNAIDIAKGQYIGFVDGDDYIDINMYEILMNEIINHNADIVMCNFICSYGDGQLKLPTIDYNICERYIGEGLDKIRIIIKHYNNYVWNKLFKKTLFNDIRFPVGKTYEDAFVTIRVVNKARRLVTVPQSLYRYTMRNDSITNMPFSSSRFDMFYANKDIFDYISCLPELESEYVMKCKNKMFVSFLFCVKSALASQADYTNEIEKMIAAIKSYDYRGCNLGTESENQIHIILKELNKFKKINSMVMSFQKKKRGCKH